MITAWSLVPAFLGRSFSAHGYAVRVPVLPPGKTEHAGTGRSTWRTTHLHHCLASAASGLVAPGTWGLGNCGPWAVPTRCHRQHIRSHPCLQQGEHPQPRGPGGSHPSCVPCHWVVGLVWHETCSLLHSWDVWPSPQPLSCSQQLWVSRASMWGAVPMPGLPFSCPVFAQENRD